MTSMRLALIFPILCTACASACSELPAAAPVGSVVPANPVQATIRVELDIFSGRPNPAWTLTGSEARSLAQRLAALSPASPRKLCANLGYRGPIVTIGQPTGEATVRIQNGIVEMMRGTRTSYHEDRNQTLERWLILTGKASLPAEPSLRPTVCAN